MVYNRHTWDQTGDLFPRPGDGAINLEEWPGKHTMITMGMEISMENT